MKVLLFKLRQTCWKRIISLKTDQHKLYYHKLNTSQKTDKLIFGGDVKEDMLVVMFPEDEKYLFISAANSTSGNELYYLDLSIPDAKIVTLIDNYENDNDVLDNKGSKVYLVTNYKAPNKRVVTFDLSNPKKKTGKIASLKLKMFCRQILVVVIFSQVI